MIIPATLEVGLPLRNNEAVNLTRNRWRGKVLEC